MLSYESGCVTVRTPLAKCAHPIEQHIYNTALHYTYTIAREMVEGYSSYGLTDPLYVQSKYFELGGFRAPSS